MWHHRAIMMGCPAFSLHCLRVYADELDACSIKSLHEAAARGYEDTVRLLLDKGIDVNAAGGHWGTALQAASHRGTAGTVKLLLDRGADVNASGGHWGNALQAASFSGQEEVVTLLVERGADVNAQGGRQYRTALQAAMCANQEGIASLLLKNGAKADIADDEWVDALSAALHARHLKDAEVLQAPEVVKNDEGHCQDATSVAPEAQTHSLTTQS
jgi:hypothetical protein